MDKIKEPLKLLLLFCLISLLLCLPSISLAVDCVTLINGDFNAQSRDDRIAIAKSLLSKIELLDSYLPNLKPSEKAWIEKEKVSIDKIKDEDAMLNRTIQLFDTPEFQHWKLKDMLRVVKDGLKIVESESVGTKQMRKLTGLKAEILGWAIVSHGLLDASVYNDAIMILKKHGRLPKDIGKKAQIFSENLGYGYMYETFGRGILQYIIIPYLSGDIK